MFLTMAKFLKHWVLPILMVMLVLGDFQVHAVPYDHGFTAECLATPFKPQYDGGIVVNSDLNQGLVGWKAFGDAIVKHRVSEDGNNYITAASKNISASSHLNKTSHSFVQDFYLEKEKLYTFSAWIQVNYASAPVAAIFKTNDAKTIYAGRVIAKKGCWSMLKGGLTVEASGPATLYFESDIPTAEIWGDSISLQPFTQEEWKSHQDSNVEKVRKGKAKFQIVDQNGKPLSNAKISIKQTRPDFPLGNAVTQHILNNTGYQKWFLSRFRYTSFEDELKWKTVEPVRGKVNYSVPDAMLQFSKTHGLKVRGHTIFWANLGQLPIYVRDRTDDRDFFQAMSDLRVNSVVNRYKGQFISWDVVNENMHFSSYEDKLGANASLNYFKKVNELDPETPLFINEYFTVEKAVDIAASPYWFLKRISEMREKGYNGPLGIGLQSHFRWVTPPFIRAALDVLASSKLPIWVTELDVSKESSDQAGYMEQALRELHAHPSVRGIIMFGAWYPQPRGCWRMCMTDDNFQNLPTGEVVDKVIHELTHKGGVNGVTDVNGYFETSLFHGEYEATVSHSNGVKSSGSRKFIVLPYVEEQGPLILKTVS